MNRSRTKQHGSQNSTAEHYQRKIKKTRKNSREYDMSLSLLFNRDYDTS